MSEKITYPLYKKGREDYSSESFIVKFDNNEKCEVVFSTDPGHPVGEIFSPKAPASVDEIWEDVHFDQEFNLFDSQPFVQFYGGSIYFNFYDHTMEYSGDIIPFELPYPEWMIKQYRKKF